MAKPTWWRACRTATRSSGLQCGRAVVFAREGDCDGDGVGDRGRRLRRRVGLADAGEGRDLQQRGRRLRPPGGRGRRRGRGGGLRGLRRRQPAAASGRGRALQRGRRRLRRDGRRRQRRRRRRRHDALRLQRREQRGEAGGDGDVQPAGRRLRRGLGRERGVGGECAARAGPGGTGERPGRLPGGLAARRDGGRGAGVRDREPVRRQRAGRGRGKRGALQRSDARAGLPDDRPGGCHLGLTWAGRWRCSGT